MLTRVRPTTEKNFNKYNLQAKRKEKIDSYKHSKPDKAGEKVF